MSSYILWSTLIFSSYAVLYKFSFLDKNIFFSWGSIFENVSIAGIFILIFFCIILAYLLSNLSFELRKKFMLLTLFFGSFLVGIIFWSVPDINPDAGRYFTEAKYLEEYGIVQFIKEWGGEVNALDYFAFVNLPAVPFIYGAIFKFAGESDIYIKIFNTLLFSLTFIVTYLIGEKLWNRNTGIYAALLLLSSPYLISEVPLTLIEIPLMFFVATAVYATISALDAERNKIWILASGIFVFLTFLSKLSAWPMLAIVPTLCYIKRGKETRYRSVLVMLLSGTLILTFVFYKIDIFIELLRGISDLIELQIHRFHESSLSLLFFQINPLVTLMAFFSSYIAFKKRDLNYLLLLSWFWIPFIFLHSSRIRYMVPALPAVAIMASIALGEIKNERSRKFLALSILLCSLAITMFFYLPFMHEHSAINIKNAAEYTNKLNVDKIEFYAVFPEDYRYNLNILLPIFDLYSAKDIATPEYFAYSKPAYGDWTWRYRYPPPYYSKDPNSKNAIVIITPAIDQELPEKLTERLEKYMPMGVYSSGYISSLRPYVVKVYMPKPSVVITYPEGGESLNGTRVVTWFSGTPTQEQRFKVEVCRNSTRICVEIGSVYNRWFYIWDIPEESPDADDYKIRVSLLDAGGETLAHNESGYFSIAIARP